MEELDRLVKEKFVPFRQRLTEIFRGKHPHIVSILQAVMGDKHNKIGMRVTEGGKIAGEYTFHMAGIHIKEAVAGKLESEVHHPFLGVVRPYVTLEREALERLMADEPGFQEEFFSTVARHLPDMTINFLK